jgi:hypothetical protein
VSVDRGVITTTRPPSLVNNPWLDGWYEGVLRGRRKSGAAGGVKPVDREVAAPSPAAAATGRGSDAPFEQTPIGGIQGGTA